METKPALSPRPLTFSLPLPEPSPTKEYPLSHSAPNYNNNFLNRLSRRISQSGANLKRKVSRSGSRSGPVRRASEADKENSRRNPVIVVVDEGQNREDEKEVVEKDVEQRPRKATLKRGLRVSVMRRTKSEGAPRGPEESASLRRGKNEEAGEKIEELVGEPAATKEDQSEVSSHRGSYFYSNSLGVCWDGRERVHPDAFAFRPYSSNCDVLPSPVIAATDNRVVYASTLSSFPPRPPLRPRTPPQLTPASQIAAEYRALHPKTPSIYSFSDFDTPPVDPDCPNDDEITPTNASPTCSSPVSPLAPLITSSLPTQAQRYSSSVHSSITSSRPSDTSCSEPLTPGLSEDSSTSLESLARDGHGQEEDPLERAKQIPRFSLVDSGPITSSHLLHPKPSLVFSEGSSTIESWRDCESYNL